MLVGIDQPRSDDLASGVDHLRIAGRDVFAYRQNAIVLDQDIATINITKIRIHRDNVSTPDESSTHASSPKRVDADSAAVAFATVTMRLGLRAMLLLPVLFKASMCGRCHTWHDCACPIWSTSSRRLHRDLLALGSHSLTGPSRV